MDGAVFAGSIIILLFSVIIHEVMHGLAALRYGDHTAQHAGRLTLNPIPHIDPVGTILVPALFILPSILFPGSGPSAIIGWAKPVPVNPFNFKDIRQGELVVSAAGVLINFFLAVTSAVVFHLSGSFASTSTLTLLVRAFQINLILAVFNALPIPPLDGSKILMSFLPPSLSAAYRSMERYGMIFLLLLLFFPIGNFTILQIIVGSLLSFFSTLFNIPTFI